MIFEVFVAGKVFGIVSIAEFVVVRVGALVFSEVGAAVEGFVV